MAAVRPLNLRWTRRARLQLSEIEEYIGSRSVKAADRVGLAIHSAVQFLQDFPGAGRPGRAPGTREWIVRRTRYIIVYEVVSDQNEVQILGIFHTAQNRPDKR